MSDLSPADRLEAGIGGVRVPEPRADRETLLLRAGFLLVVVGIVAVFVGYVGASGTRDVSEQVPYLISGGLLGLASVTLGTGLVMRYSLARLFRYWLARLLAEHGLQTDRTVDALGRIEAVLAEGRPGSSGGET